MRYILLSFLIALTQTSWAHSREEKNGSTPPRNIEQLAKTITELEEAIKKEPVNAELHIRLGFTYTKLDKADEAQQAFENAARLDPKKAIVHYMLGLIYEKKGMRDNAIASWKACLENTGERHMRETALKHLHNLTNQ